MDWALHVVEAECYVRWKHYPVLEFTTAAFRGGATTYTFSPSEGNTPTALLFAGPKHMKNVVAASMDAIEKDRRDFSTRCLNRLLAHRISKSVDLREELISYFLGHYTAQLRSERWDTRTTGHM